MAFLIGQNMTGGYGGADILHDCTIGVEKGEIAGCRYMGHCVRLAQ